MRGYTIERVWTLPKVQFTRFELDSATEDMVEKLRKLEAERLLRAVTEPDVWTRPGLPRSFT